MVRIVASIKPVVCDVEIARPGKVAENARADIFEARISLLLILSSPAMNCVPANIPYFRITECKSFKVGVVRGAHIEHSEVSVRHQKSPGHLRQP